MTFDTLREHVAGLSTDRIPQGLSEMLACEHLARYLNSVQGSHYDGVSKDEHWDDDGVDAKLYESGNSSADLYVQVTRAREYNMSPEYGESSLEMTGQPIIDALEYKCHIYQKRGVYTREIVLLIIGVTPASIVREHLEHEHFAKHFREATCFKNIYYLTGSDIVKLK